jgi:hypothetical protein
MAIRGRTLLACGAVFLLVTFWVGVFPPVTPRIFLNRHRAMASIRNFNLAENNYAAMHPAPDLLAISVNSPVSWRESCFLAKGPGIVSNSSARRGPVKRQGATQSGQRRSNQIAVVGAESREARGGDAYPLYWSFAMAGFPASEASSSSEQTLALGFKASVCSSVAVRW